MIVCTLIASALICNDYGLCLKQMKLVRMKNSVIENVEIEDQGDDGAENELETKILDELDEYVTVDAIHDECMNAALSYETDDNKLQSVGVSEDSIDDFVERYVAKIIADACQAIKPKEKQPLRVSDTFADNYIDNLLKDVVRSRAKERKYERAVAKLGDIDLNRFSILN